MAASFKIGNKVIFKPRIKKQHIKENWYHPGQDIGNGPFKVTRTATITNKVLRTSACHRQYLCISYAGKELIILPGLPIKFSGYWFKTAT